MKTWKKILIIILAAAVTLGIVAAAIAFIGTGGLEEGQALKKESLTKYEYSKAGDMRGARYSMEIMAYDDEHALVRVSNMDWYAAPIDVEEYLVDAQILPDIEKVFRSRHMKNWQHRRISHLFVADGAFKDYSFTFGTTTYGFSAQYYAGHYRRGVDAIEEVIDKYSANKIPLSHTVLPNPDADPEPDDDGTVDQETSQPTAE